MRHARHWMRRVSPSAPRRTRRCWGADPRRCSIDRPHSRSLWIMSELIGTNRDLPNFVWRTCSRPPERSTSPMVSRRASPNRRPATYKRVRAVPWTTLEAENSVPGESCAGRQEAPPFLARQDALHVAAPTDLQEVPRRDRGPGVLDGEEATEFADQAESILPGLVRSLIGLGEISAHHLQGDDRVLAREIAAQESVQTAEGAGLLPIPTARRALELEEALQPVLQGRSECWGRHWSNSSMERATVLRWARSTLV